MILMSAKEAGEKVLPLKPRTGIAAVVLQPDGLRGAALNGKPEPYEFSVPLHSGLTPIIVVDTLRRQLKETSDDTNWTGVAVHGLNGSFREHATISWRNYQLPLYSFDGSDGEAADPLTLLIKLQEMHTRYKRPRVQVDSDGRVVTSKLATWREQISVLPEQRAQVYTQTLDNLGRTLYYENVVTLAVNTTAVAGGVAQMNAEANRLFTDYNEDVAARRARGEDVREIDFRWIVASSPHVDYKIARSIAKDFGITADIEDEAIQQYFMNKYGDTSANGKRYINIFRLTKDRHNALQNQAQPGYEYTNLDDWYYHAWAKTQWKYIYKPVIEKLIKEGKKVVVKWEDQQMFAMQQYLLEDFPKDLYPNIYNNSRLHIHVFARLARNSETPQGKIAASMLKDLQGTNAYMAHIARPEDPTEFLFQDEHGNVHHTINEITVWAPASMDTTTGNRIKMHPEKETVVQAENFDFLVQTGQSTEYFDLEAFGETNRWDRSKNKYVGIQAYSQHLKHQMEKGVPIENILQYRTVGMTPNDDPEGKLIYTAYMLGLHPELRDRPEYADFMKWVDESDPTMLKPKFTEDMVKEPEAKDPTRFMPADWNVIQLLNQLAKANSALKKKIEMFRFTYDEHDDLNRNAVESSCVAHVHASAAEACEDNITGHVSQRRWVWVADAGGAPNQVKPGITGDLFEPGDYMAVASGMNDFFEEIYPYKDLLRSFRDGIAANVKEKYTTPYNVVKILGMSALLVHQDFRQKVVDYMNTHDGRRPFVHELLGQYIPLGEELAAQDEQVITHPERVVYTRIPLSA